MSDSTPSSSTLRFRHNASKPCAMDDTGDARAKMNSSTTTMASDGCDLTQTGNNIIHDNNDRNRGRVRMAKRSNGKKAPLREDGIYKNGRRNEDQSLRHLMIIAATLSALIVGGLVYLTRLVLLIDPDLQYELPYLQEYINDRNSFASSWHSKWSTSLPQEKRTTIHTPSDDVSTLNFDASEIGQEGNDFGDQSEAEHENDSTNGHQDDRASLPPSSIYTIPNSMPHIGDKSEEYARLRQDWDERYPPDSPERSLRVVQELLNNGDDLSSIYHRLQAPPLPSIPSTQTTTRNDDKATLDDDDDNQKNWDYDIYNCPDDPPPGYPREYKTMDILKHWPPTQSLPVGTYHPDKTKNKHAKEGDEEIYNGSAGKDEDADTPPVMAHLGLCVFDFSRDYQKAMRYRSEEVPFVVRNDPSVAATVERWNDETYRRKLFGSMFHSNNNNTKDDVSVDSSTRLVYHRAERSITNQILFRHARKKKPPKFNSYPNQSKKDNRQGQDQVPNEKESPPMPPPTKLVSMTYDQWHELAMEKEGNSIVDSETGIQYHDANLSGRKSSFYYYFRLVGCGEKEDCERNSTEYLFDELPFFQPRGHYNQGFEPRSESRGQSDVNNRRGRGQEQSLPDSSSHSYQESMYLVQPEKQRGIHCRFGMPGMIAANHYDASRNAIAVLGGSRRYILSRPEQCPNLGLYPLGHPSARHSKVDWTTAVEDHQDFFENDNETGEEYEALPWSSPSSGAPSWRAYRKALSLLANNATSTEVILQAGDVLYLPSYWFHFIISLTTNMQCNTRSGRDGRDDQIMTDCGFPPAREKK